MKFTAVQNFTSLAELLRFYGDADEIVFNSHTELGEAEIAEACHDGRWLANRLRLRNGAKPAEEIAASYGCRVVRESWQVAEGKMIFLGECLLRKKEDHPQEGDMLIRVNSDATTSLAEFMKHWADDAERQWFNETKISEVVVAHELFHLLEQKPHSTKLELAAHAFARAMTELPFSPLLYDALLVRLATGKKTLTI